MVNLQFVKGQCLWPRLQNAAAVGSTPVPGATPVPGTVRIRPHAKQGPRVRRPRVVATAGIAPAII
jgi:hypothetical protein